jgi:hypothetical protein
MTPTMHICTKLDMVMKPTNAHKWIRPSYKRNMPPTCFVHKEGVLQDLQKFCNPMHKCKILSFKHVWFETHNKNWGGGNLVIISSV